MRKLSKEKRIQIISCLCEGMAIRAIVRICGVSKLTVLRLLADVGSLCQQWHDLNVRGLNSKRVECDEIWSFVGAKQKSVNAGKKGDGDCWTWIGIDAETKLVVSYLVGLRDSGYAHEFVKDLADRLNNRIQLTSDGLKLYVEAVESAFADEVDFSQLVKLYGKDQEEKRYSPPKCIGCNPTAVVGNPDPRYVSTSYVERQNLTLRMHNRRTTRLTNSFSKKWTNHEHAMALHFFYYNWCLYHITLEKTPAQAAGLTDRKWTIKDLVELLEREEKLLNRGGRINREDRN